MDHKIASHAEATREDLMRNAQDSYAKASKAGGSSYASVTSYLAQATGAVKDTTFDKWSHSELKSYLDSYGSSISPDSSVNELREAAIRNAQYFHQGSIATPQDMIFTRIKQAAHWLLNQLRIGASSGRAQGWDTPGRAKETAAHTTTSIIREEL
jgi:Putative nuclear envelope organisation protein